MDIRKTFGTSAALETEGIELHIDGDAYVTLARAGGANAKYENAVRKHMAPHRRSIDAGTFNNGTANEVLQKAYAETVVLGWRGIDEDGVPVPFTHANVIRLFKELPDFWRVVQEEAQKLANYKTEQAHDAGKESLAS